MRGFLQKLQRSPIEVSFSEAEENCERDSEGTFLNSLRLIERIAFGRKSVLREADIADVAQEVALRLWKWRGKFSDKSDRMTREDWDSFTARTAHNEINRYCSKRIRKNEVQLEEVPLIQAPAIEGDADAEMLSLVTNVWQGICGLSVYQRRALLLHSPDLLIYFMQFSVTEHTIVQALGMTEEEWGNVVLRLPLTDVEIATMTNTNGLHLDLKLAAQAIKKARFDARKKLKRLEK